MFRPQEVNQALLDKGFRVTWRLQSHMESMQSSLETAKIMLERLQNNQAKSPVTAPAGNFEAPTIPDLLGIDLLGVAPASPANKSGKPVVPSPGLLNSYWAEDMSVDGAAGGQENPGPLQDPPPTPSGGNKTPTSLDPFAIVGLTPLSELSIVTNFPPSVSSPKKKKRGRGLKRSKRSLLN